MSDKPQPVLRTRLRCDYPCDPACDSCNPRTASPPDPPAADVRHPVVNVAAAALVDNLASLPLVTIESVLWAIQRQQDECQRALSEGRNMPVALPAFCSEMLDNALAFSLVKELVCLAQYKATCDKEDSHV